MYIPAQFHAKDQDEILSFMQQYSFATLVTADADYPTASHLPFVVEKRAEETVLISHFARANPQWKGLEGKPVLVMFNEPHAYISPKHYDNVRSVPTWNYLAVHAYGKARLITAADEVFALLEKTIGNYEAEYSQQWDTLPDDFKHKMAGGIVAFEITVTDLQGKKKLSQNKTAEEQQRIITALAGSENAAEHQLAAIMAENMAKHRGM